MRYPWPRPLATIEQSGLFDAAYYCAANGLGNMQDGDALRHFVHRGAASGLRPHPLFDPDFYLSQTRAKAARTDPLLHYLRGGWRKGLRPSACFDPEFYASANPDVRIGGFEPLTHYAARGQREAREPNAQASRPFFPLEPTREEWNSLPLRQAGVIGVVDVIIPAFSGQAETLRTIHRVLAARSARPVEVVVINDASPNAGLVAVLEDLARANRITLLSHASNRGFVASVNRGMALHPSRDVILLNADTEVYGDWVDRLADTASSDESVGTVTPWSSDATILSYPVRLRSNGAPLETSDLRLDGIAAEMPNETIEIPTAVGSCMYIKRACLKAVGPFDEERFGRGYGEENDFSCRARKLGWRHVAGTSVFVRHYGSRSFGAEKTRRIQAALAMLARLHPDYLRSVRHFIKADPLRRSRQLFDEARIRAAAHVQVMADLETEFDRDTRLGIVRVTQARGPHFGLLDLQSDRVPVTPNLPPLDPSGPSVEWARRLSALNVRAIRTAGRDSILTGFLESVSRSCHLPIERTG